MQNTDLAPRTFESELALFREPEIDETTRTARFNTLINTPGGPFPDPTLSMLHNIRNLARGVTSGALRSRRISPSFLSFEEVAHEALIAFYEGHKRIRDLSKLTPWLRKVMNRAIPRLLGQRSLLVALTGPDLSNDALRVPGPREDSSRLTSETLRILVSAVARLTPTLQEVVILHGADGQSHEEVARRLGTSVGTVRVRWHRARQILRKELRALSKSA